MLAEVTPVSTPDNDATPDVTFSSTEAGTITYGGGCDSVTTAASSGNNTVTLDSDGAGSDLSDGTYAACTITVTDAAGNASTALTLTSFTIDTDNPDVTIDEGASQDDPTNTSPIVFDVVFDEAINDTTFTDADIDTTGSTATPGAITVTEVAPMDDTTFEVSIVVTGDGDLTATVMTGSIADLAGNLNNAAISTDNTVTYDTMAPSDPGSSPDLIAASDSGASSSDNITSDTTPTCDIECTET